MFLRSGAFDNNRNKRWITASYGLARVEMPMVQVVQDLGVLDCKLVAEDAHFDQLSDEEKSTIEENIRLSDRFTLSRL